MNLNQGSSVTRSVAVARAEFLKVWASRIPLVMLLAVPIGAYLFVFELYHVERINDRLHVANALSALPLVVFAIWRTMLLQAAVLTFAAFWATLDSQYGMIRVACCQPITRLEYLVGKWCGIMLHVVVIVVLFVASLLAWTGVYSGFRGVHLHDVLSVVRFAVELTVFVVAFASIAMAVASLRRTVGSGIVLGLIAFILLAFMTMLPFGVVPPRLVFMRYFFFPLSELPNPLATPEDSLFRQIYSVADFYRTVLITPLLFLLPAILYFRSRDIVE